MVWRHRISWQTPTGDPDEEKSSPNRSNTDLRSSTGSGGDGEPFDGVAGGNRFNSRGVHQGGIYCGCWRGPGNPDLPRPQLSVQGFWHELGATIGASTNKLVGRALNMRAPGDLAGTYSAIGAGWPAAPGVAAAKRKGSDSSVARRQGRRGIVGQRGWCRDHYGVTQAPV